MALAMALGLFNLPAAAGPRVALIVGNAGYAGPAQLPNPAHDAQDISAALEALGFKVITGLNLNKAAFDAKLHEFARISTGADVAFFFYSGHGMQINGINYLVPIDAPVTKEDLDFQTVTLDFVQKLLERAKTKIVMLDACRNNPFAAQLGANMGTRAVNGNAGLAVTTAPDLGYFIAFATQPGHVASDGAGRNSPFTNSLKAHIATPGLSISDLMIVVRNDVVQATNSSQIPWDHSALSSRFYFREGPAATEPAEALSKSSDAAEVWGWVRDTSNPAALQQFISLYGDTPFAGEAKTRLATLTKPEGRTAAISLPIVGNVLLRPSKPAFDCRTNNTDSEVTICNKPELSLLDNELSHLYTQLFQTLGDDKRKSLINEQRLWIKDRNACATEVHCLTEKYHDRIKKLKASPIGVAKLDPAIRPSFDCGAPRSPAEVAVCTSADLAQLDLELDRAYTQKVKAPKLGQLQRLVRSQRQWLRDRDTCSGSIPCLKVQYRARIQQLQD